MKKKHRSMLIIGLMIIVIATAAGYYMVGNTPQQPYKEVRKMGNIEIRYYPKAWMATVTTPETSYKKSSNSSFRKLAEYIFGGNQNKKDIAMTAPVHMNFYEDSSAMSFVMPAGYDKNNLPAPLRDEIKLHESEPEYVAALRFGGYASDEDIAKKKAELLNQLDALDITYKNNVRYLGYNAPWDFFFRRNEVIVTISQSDAL